MSHKMDEYSSTYNVDNFSSTTQLAVGSKESVNNNDDYHPFKDRSVKNPNSTLGAIIHLLKGFLGTGILAMSSAFRNAGLLFGFVGTLVIGSLTTYTVYMLVSTSTEICRRTKTPTLGFSETAETIFKNGPKPVRKFSSAASYFVDAAVCLTCLLTSCVYVVFISENLKQLFDYWYPSTTFSIYIYMLFIMSPLLFLGQVRTLKHLVPYSLLANVFMVVAFSITLYYLLTDIPNPKDRSLYTGIDSLPMFFVTVLFAMEGITTVMPIENSMAKPQHFLGCPGVLTTAMSTVITLYAAIGFFGYLKYGDETKGSITLNLPVCELPAQIVKLLIALSVFFTYFLQMYVPIDITWRKILEPRINGSAKRNFAQIIYRCTFVLLTIGIAAAVPDLEPIIGLVGSICSSTLALLIPAVMETVLLWDGELGVFKWRLIKNIILVFLALSAAILGSTQSIIQIIG